MAAETAAAALCRNDWTVVVHNIQYSLRYVMQEKDKDAYKSETALLSG